MDDFLPLIPMRGGVLFPNYTGHFDLGRDKSVAACKNAADRNGLVLFARQKDETVNAAAIGDLRPAATLAKILNASLTPGGSLNVLAKGIKRVNILGVESGGAFLNASYAEIKPLNAEGADADAFRRGFFELLEELAPLDRSISPESLAALRTERDNNVLIDAAAPLLSVRDAYPLLEENDTVKRFGLLLELLRYEAEVLKTERRINVKVKQSLDKSHREHILKEQMRVISEELDEGGDDEIRRKIEKLNAPDEIKNKLLKENSRLKKISITSPEYSIITEYTEFASELPWNGCSEEIRDLPYAKTVLDRDHYGLKKVKERILEYIAVHNLTGSFKSPVLCFIGPPGVGKTSVAKSVASATGRKFVRMSLGGISDEAEIRGHRKTYVAALPGRILNGIKLAGASNPVFLLDEIDKLSRGSNKGDPANALLEVLDSEQNSSFRDNYLELPYDLSNVMFLMTANSAEEIPKPLLDRMEIIEMPSYTYNEKFHIAKNYLVEKAMKNHGLEPENISVEDEAIYEIIYKYTSEAGVRELSRQIAKIMRKTAYLILTTHSTKLITVNKDNLAEFLGGKTVVKQKKRKNDEVGVATGLAWTAGGGDILPIEINTVKGKGEIIATGNLKDIIKESIKVALTYIRSVAAAHRIPDEAFSELDYHIHLPETAVPKEGPSAGVGFAAAIYSALTRRPVRSDAAMTGEISLRGGVTAVGGIKEKIMAGHRAGINKFFIPKDNAADIEEIPDEVMSKIEIFTVSHFDDLIKSGLVFADAEDNGAEKKNERERAADVIIGTDKKDGGPVSGKIDADPGNLEKIGFDSGISENDKNDGGKGGIHGETDVIVDRIFRR
ncbi:MAG: endopeptidase La [Clostridiales bacterium]|jgi:ATP-dependent Lon protease|nr:endopeptidase La [Clostridiales bacterium]